MFIVIVDFMCWIVVLLLKKGKNNCTQVHIQLILYGITTG